MIPYNLLIILRSVFIRVCLIVLVTGGFSQIAFAQSANAAQMLINFSNTVPKLMQMITAVAYVIGMFMVYKGVVGLKVFGEQRTQMSGQAELKGPLIYILVGTALLYIPSSVQVGMNTFWSAPNPYGYIQQTTDQWSTVYQDAFMIAQLIGTVAFIRGLVILTQLGQQAQPGTFGKALAHIIGGVMLINLYQFLTSVNSTLGLIQY